MGNKKVRRWLQAMHCLNYMGRTSECRSCKISPNRSSLDRSTSFCRKQNYSYGQCKCKKKCKASLLFQVRICTGDRSGTWCLQKHTSAGLLTLLFMKRLLMVLGLATTDFFTFFLESAPLAPALPVNKKKFTPCTKLFTPHFPTLSHKIQLSCCVT